MPLATERHPSRIGKGELQLSTDDTVEAHPHIARRAKFRTHLEILELKLHIFAGLAVISCVSTF